MDVSHAGGLAPPSHEQYIDSLIRPTVSEVRRISDIQQRKEHEIDSKYATPTIEHNAATTIQKAYRGHRERRQLEGLTLDPSSRWTEVIRELRYRSAVLPSAQLERPRLSADSKPRSSSDAAKASWRRLGYVAEHASAGERTRSTSNALSTETLHGPDDEAPSMLMDIRYFLEMVDMNHRYGSNLQVFHEEWLRSRSDKNFFHWLDHGEGKHLDLPGCSRAKLDKERIRYLSKDERRDYLVEVDEDGKLRWAKSGELITTSITEFKDSMSGIVRRSDDSAVSFADNSLREQASPDEQTLYGLHTTQSPSQLDGTRSDSSSEVSGDEHIGAHATPGDRPRAEAKKRKKGIIASPATILNKLLRASVRPGTWIYCADTVGRLYIGIKDSGAFQHASFLSGGRISSAGLIGIDNGQLTYLSPLSGHYRPTTQSLRRFISSLKSQGVDLSHLRVSHAYEVLLGIEYYGKTKKGLKKLHPHKERHEQASTGADRQLHDAINNMSATDLIEQNWEQRSRRSTLTKMMGDLRVRHHGATHK